MCGEVSDEGAAGRVQLGESRIGHRRGVQPPHHLDDGGRRGLVVVGHEVAGHRAGLRALQEQSTARGVVGEQAYGAVASVRGEGGGLEVQASGRSELQDGRRAVGEAGAGHPVLTRRVGLGRLDLPGRAQTVQHVTILSVGRPSLQP
jgi:hypothetical protein